jgi:hypothetical protein
MIFCSLVGWLVCNHLLLRDFGPYGIISMNVCVITVAMVLLLRDFGGYVFYLYFGWLVGCLLIIYCKAMLGLIG